MAEQLEFIIFQNWILLGLLIVIWCCSLICNFFTLKDRKDAMMKNDEVSFHQLWNKDRTEELIELSESEIEENPNNIEAVYFRALALRKLGRNEEAITLFEKMKEIDPTKTPGMDENIADLKSLIAANNQKQSDA